MFLRSHYNISRATDKRASECWDLTHCNIFRSSGDMRTPRREKAVDLYSHRIEDISMLLININEWMLRRGETVNVNDGG